MARKKGMQFIPYDYEAAYNKALEDMHEWFIENLFQHRKKVVYALKEITAGDQFEIEIYPQFRSMDEVPPEGRTIKKDNNKAQKNLNDKNARKYVERLINENFSDRDIWMTLTYDDAHLPPDGDVDAAIKNVQKYIRRINYQRKKRGLPNAKYVYVTAYNPDAEIRWHVQLGRQNGKSFINGILACYYGNFDGYKYGKIFCTATKQDQANIVFDEVAKFINSDEDLSEWFKVHDHNHTIDCLLTHSEIKALSGDTKSLDGHRAYLGIVDEYHAHKTNQMYKLLEGGIKKLKSALISVITTAGFDLKSPCYKLYEYCCNLLKGVFENDSQFVYIAQMDV
nr:terminase large subunit [uncultured Blautia sp.]